MNHTTFGCRALIVASLAALLSGCSLTGLNASDEFSCPSDAGYPCESTAAAYQKSVSGQYALEDRARREAVRLAREEEKKGLVERIKEKIAGLNENEKPEEDDLEKGATGKGINVDALAPRHTAARPLRTTIDPALSEGADFDPAVVVTNLSARPLRLPEEIVTIWIAPWTDAEGDFHEGEKIHARVLDARWAAARRRAETAEGGRAVVSLPFAHEQSGIGSRARIAEPRKAKVDEEPFERSLPDGLPVPDAGALIGEGAAALEKAKQNVDRQR